MSAHGAKAQEVLSFIAAYTEANGYSPSISDICVGVGLKSKATVWYYLDDLRAAGKVTWLDKTPRTLRVVGSSP